MSAVSDPIHHRLRRPLTAALALLPSTAGTCCSASK